MLFAGGELEEARANLEGWQKQYRTSEKQSKTRVFVSNPQTVEKHQGGGGRGRGGGGVDPKTHKKTCFGGLTKNTETHFYEFADTPPFSPSLAHRFPHMSEMNALSSLI